MIRAHPRLYTHGIRSPPPRDHCKSVAIYPCRRWTRSKVPSGRRISPMETHQHRTTMTRKATGKRIHMILWMECKTDTGISQNLLVWYRSFFQFYVRLIAWLTDCSIDLLPDWLIDWLLIRLIDWLIDWLHIRLIHWLIDWLLIRLIDWLIDWSYLEVHFVSFRSPSVPSSRMPQIRNQYDDRSSESGDERRDGSRDHDDFSPSLSRSSYSTHSDYDDEDGEAESRVSAETVNSVGSAWTVTDPMEKVMRAFGMVMPAAGGLYPSLLQNTLPYGHAMPPPPPAFFPTALPPMSYTQSRSTDVKFLYPHAAGDYLSPTALSVNNEEKPPLLDVVGESAVRRSDSDFSRFPHDLSGIFCRRNFVKETFI